MTDILVLGKNLTTGQNEAMSKIQADNSTGQLKLSGTGQAPMTVADTTVVTNLNADQCDGNDATDFFNLDHASVSGILDLNHGGTNADFSSTGPGALVQASSSANITIQAQLDETLGGTGTGIAGSYTTGDVIYASGTDTLATLAAGTQNYVLTMGASVPQWSTAGTPASHASTHEIGGGDVVTLEDLQTGAGTVGWALTNDGDGTVSWTNYGATLPDGTTNNNATLRWDTSGDTWQVNTNFDIDSSGNVTDGQWTATAIVTTYGGTGLTSYSQGDILYYNSGTTLTALAAGSQYDTIVMSGVGVPAWGTLSVEGGGTGITTVATGDILYASGPDSIAALAKGTADQFLRMGASNIPEWDTINLDDLSNVDAMSEVDQDILFYDTDGWNRKAVGSNGQFLGVSGGALAWLDAGTGYTWTLDGDSGTPQTIADGNTGTIAGGNGIVTVAGATDTVTVTAVGGAASAPVVACTVTGSGIGLDLSTIDGTGISTTGGALLIDTGSTVTFSGATWTFPTDEIQITGTPDSANDGVNKGYVDSIVTGLLWKNPCDVRNLVGNAAFATLNGLGTNAGDAYVVTDAGTLTRGTLGVTAGDLVEDNGTVWVMINQAVGGFVPIGTRAILAKATALISPYTNGTDDNKIVDFTGASNTGVDTGDAIHSAATLISDDGHVGYYDNSGYVFEFTTSVPLSTWIQFTGAGQINAGAGMTKSGNTLNVGSGSTGNINGLAVGADTLGAAVDGSSIEIASNLLGVKANGIGTTELDLNITPTWTSTHDFQGGLKTDDIDESTGGVGVTIDNLLIKDGAAARSNMLTSTFYDAGENIAVYEIVYLESDGDLNKASATTSAGGFGSVVGINSATVTTGNPVLLWIEGHENADTPVVVQLVGSLSVTVGDPVYVSLTAGSGTNDVSGFTAGDWIQKLGNITDTSGYAGAQQVTMQLNMQEATLIV